VLIDKFNAADCSLQQAAVLHQSVNIFVQC
jgi:hypothetical protein